MDVLLAALDACVKVRIRKVENNRGQKVSGGSKKRLLGILSR